MREAQPRAWRIRPVTYLLDMKKVCGVIPDVVELLEDRRSLVDWLTVAATASAELAANLALLIDTPVHRLAAKPLAQRALTRLMGID